MIKYFSVENFVSIANEIYFECDISKKGLESNEALVGINASGKTNILTDLAHKTILIYNTNKNHQI